MGFLLSCIVAMGIVASLLFYLGIKVSYSFIRYSPPITLSVGVILYLIKFIFTTNSMRLIDFALDFFVLCMLLSIWFVAILETVIIDSFENGHEYKQDLLFVSKKFSVKVVKPTFQRIVSSNVLKRMKAIILLKVPLKMEENQKENNG